MEQVQVLTTGDGIFVRVVDIMAWLQEQIELERNPDRLTLLKHQLKQFFELLK